jgi:hypothetical protein
MKNDVSQLREVEREVSRRMTAGGIAGSAIATFTDRGRNLNELDVSFHRDGGSRVGMHVYTLAGSVVDELPAVDLAAQAASYFLEGPKK